MSYQSHLCLLLWFCQFLGINYYYYHLLCHVLSSADWGMPQTRQRTYFILVQNHLASKQKINHVFEHLLRTKVLPAFSQLGKASVSQVRDYVRFVRDALETELTNPPASKDSSGHLEIWKFRAAQSYSSPPPAFIKMTRANPKIFRAIPKIFRANPKTIQGA